jgi:hypothetical protein
MTQQGERLPPLIWPLGWVGFTFWLIVASFNGIFINPGSDPVSPLLVFPIEIGLFCLALAYYQHRVKQRRQWRGERRREEFIAWLESELPEPEYIDWEAFERMSNREAARRARRKKRGL